MSFVTAEENKNVETLNGAVSYSKPDPNGENNGRLSLFFKAIRELDSEKLYKYLQESASEDLVDTFVLCFHLRDSRGGKGERLLGRHAMAWLCVNYPIEFRRVLHLVPEYGRWDDLLYLFPSVLKVSDFRKMRSEYGDDDIEYIRTTQNMIVEFFCDQLEEDKSNMEDGLPISLCAKWTPTECNSLDRLTGVYDELVTALGVTPKEFRKQYNTPLRAYLKIVETYMCKNQWSDIDFNKVPSCAMKKLKSAFESHEPDRFKAWADSLKTGDTKVNANQLYPHELIREVRQKGFADDVVEAQWNVIIQSVRGLGVLSDCIAVIDTSTSMNNPNYLPLDVAVAMGMIISDVTTGPFHGNLMTFNTTPAFAVIPEGTMYERFSAVRNMAWGGSTNLEGLFNLVLDTAIANNVTSERMPKRMFIISDMQFNTAIDHCGTSVTNMEKIEGLYRVRGYQRPQIMFWNVNGETSDFPCTTDSNGTVMISGFSPCILKSVMNGKNCSSIEIMRITLNDDRYAPIREELECETGSDSDSDISILSVDETRDENSTMVQQICSVM
jgi:hypothetical protein